MFLWDPALGQRAFPPFPPAGRFTHARFAPDGRRLVAASGDGSVRLWDLATIRARQPLIRHGMVLNTTKFDRSGQKIVTSGTDATACVWDARTHEPIFRHRLVHPIRPLSENYFGTYVDTAVAIHAHAARAAILGRRS